MLGMAEGAEDAEMHDMLRMLSICPFAHLLICSFAHWPIGPLAHRTPYRPHAIPWQGVPDPDPWQRPKYMAGVLETLNPKP